MTSTEIKEALLKPETSRWLKKAIRDSDKREVFDAAIDADLLLRYLKAKLQETQSILTGSKEGR